MDQGIRIPCVRSLFENSPTRRSEAAALYFIKKS